MLKYILLILLIPVCYSQVLNSSDYKIDFVIKPSSILESSDYKIYSVLNPTSNPTTKGWLFYSEFEVVSVVIPPTTPGGGVYRTISTKYYDVEIDVFEDKYRQNQKISANITIINKGYTPDRDAILTTYLFKDGTKYREKREYFELVDPTCNPEFVYQRDTGLCENTNGQTEIGNKFVILRELYAPMYADLGEWKFVAEYDTSIQPLITVYDTFELVRKNFTGEIALITLLIFFILHQHNKHKELEKKVRRDERKINNLYNNINK